MISGVSTNVKVEVLFELTQSFVLDWFVMLALLSLLLVLLGFLRFLGGGLVACFLCLLCVNSLTIFALFLLCLSFNPELFFTITLLLLFLALAPLVVVFLAIPVHSLGLLNEALLIRLKLFSIQIA